MPERKSSFIVMPPVSSVLESCGVGRGGNKSQPVGGLCEGHRTRRAGRIKQSLLIETSESYARNLLLSLGHIAHIQCNFLVVNNSTIL